MLAAPAYPLEDEPENGSEGHQEKDAAHHEKLATYFGQLFAGFAQLFGFGGWAGCAGSSAVGNVFVLQQWQQWQVTRAEGTLNAEMRRPWLRMCVIGLQTASQRKGNNGDTDCG